MSCLAGETNRASQMEIVGDGGADGTPIVVSYAGVLDIAYTCWKTGGGSAGNSA